MNTPEAVKIASYNIMSGGFSDYSEDIPKPERLPLIVKIVKKLQADFIGLIDTYRWDSIYKESEIAEIFGYAYARIINLDDDRLRETGHNNGITVLTNLSVKSTKVLRIYNRNALLTTVVINNTEVDIVTVYLDDISEETRLRQAQALIGSLKDKQAVLMGDFNTVDPNERSRVRSSLGQLLIKQPVLKLRLWPKILNMLRGKVIPYLHEHKFNDADTLKLPTAPTQLLHLPTDKPVLRLDYIWYRGSIVISDIEVFRYPIADLASDHYPITGMLSRTVT